MVVGAVAAEVAVVVEAAAVEVAAAEEVAEAVVVGVVLAAAKSGPESHEMLVRYCGRYRRGPRKSYASSGRLGAGGAESPR
jgi:hypothetical protein